jgi:hypothetical protein
MVEDVCKPTLSPPNGKIIFVIPSEQIPRGVAKKKRKKCGSLHKKIYTCATI